MKPSSLPADDPDWLPTRSSLLRRLKDWNDQESWTDFFETYRRLIYRRARQANLSEQDAEEVVQETALAVLKKMHSFKYDPAIASFKTWLFQIVRCRIADQFRRRARGGNVVEPWPNEDPNVSSLEEIADPASLQPDAAWEAEWEQNLVAAAVERLRNKVKPEHFQVYEYLVLQGHSPAETAAHLRTNQARLYWIKHRVGRQLRQELEWLRHRYF